IAVVLRILEKKTIVYDSGKIRISFWLYMISLLPSFLLSVLWYDLAPVWHVVAAIAGVLQLLCIFMLCIAFYGLRGRLKLLFSGWARFFFVFAICLLFVKSVLEVGAAVPGLSVLIYESRSVVIGYLYLVLLGVVSMLCLALY